MTFKFPQPARFPLLLGSLLLASSLSAEEPTKAELLAEIHALNARLAHLESLVLAQTPDAPTVASSTSDTRRSPATPPRKPAPSIKARPKEKGFDVQIYGYVKIDAAYETDNTFINEIPFWVLPTHDHPTNCDGEFTMSAKESRLGVKVQGPELGKGRLRAQYEGDFYGNFALTDHHAYTPRSRHIYLEWASEEWSLLAGKTWDTYLTVFPKTVNFGAFNMQGQLGLRRAQFRATRTIELSDSSHLRAKIALAEPLGGLHGADLDEDGMDDGAESGLPLLQYNFEYKREGLRFALSGFAGRECLDPAPSVVEGEYATWAVIFGGEAKLTEALTLRGSAFTGTNLDSAWGGLVQGINTVQGHTIDSSGGWIYLSKAE